MADFEDGLRIFYQENMMERIEMPIEAGARLNDMHEELNEYYNFIKARRIKYGNTEDFVVFGVFNGVEILHTDTPDEISVKVTGKTVAEREAAQKVQQDEYERKEDEHKAKLLTLIEEYRKRARGIIPEDKLELWDEIVPIRLDDLYHGMELDEWLKMVGALNESGLTKEGRFQLAKDIFEDAGHSGMSGTLVLSGMRKFHPDGIEFVKFMEW